MMHQGAIYQLDQGCTFMVWAPSAKNVRVHIQGQDDRFMNMERLDFGFWRAEAEDVRPGDRYLYQLNGTLERPDPASFSQPEGVHGASEVIDPTAFPWTDDAWQGVALRDLILYELHVGTFTREGTFDAIIPRLADLKALGITALELMPVSQFPGGRNWGYDGVYPYAAQNSYGGADGLKRLIDACHRQGLAVILDVVYNHLGPEGNTLRDFGPYFTDRYRTPWGAALNLDGPDSDPVRDFFLHNAECWLDLYHVDGLRLDALHAIIDTGARHLLEELRERTDQVGVQRGRPCLLIGESDLNDVQLIRSRHKGGYGLDAQWSDDLHHSLHTLLTGEQHGYYTDFGRLEHLAKALREGFVYDGCYSVYRRRRFGSSSRECPAEQFVICAQNHDQIGNRMMGERLSRLTDLESLKLAAGVVLLSPYVPLLFMGEEYAEDKPFLYFVSHSEPELIEAVRLGRQREFEAFRWSGPCPDPQSEETFIRSTLDWDKRDQSHHRVMWAFYRQLIILRKSLGEWVSKKGLRVRSLERSGILVCHRHGADVDLQWVANFSTQTQSVRIRTPEGTWVKVLDSADPMWLGSGSTVPDRITEDRVVAMAPKSITVFTWDHGSERVRAATAHAEVSLV